MSKPRWSSGSTAARGCGSKCTTGRIASLLARPDARSRACWRTARSSSGAVPGRRCSSTRSTVRREASRSSCSGARRTASPAGRRTRTDARSFTTTCWGWRFRPTTTSATRCNNAHIWSWRLRPTVTTSAVASLGTAAGCQLPGFYELDNGVYDLSQDVSQRRAGAGLHARGHAGEQGVRAQDVQRHAVRRGRQPDQSLRTAISTRRGPHNPKTLRNTPNFYSMFPILPSVGVVFNFFTTGNACASRACSGS